MHHLPNLLFFGIPLLYYYINLNSSIISYLSCGDIYLPFGISLLASYECNFGEGSVFGVFFETLVILSAILLPIKSPVPSDFFRVSLFEAIFIASVAYFLALSISFWLYLLLIFLPIFLAKDKNP